MKSRDEKGNPTYKFSPPEAGDRPKEFKCGPDTLDFMMTLRKK